MKNDNKTSLEKSHSKSSNAKLTLLCFLATVFSSATFVGFAMLNGVLNKMGYIYLGVAVGSLIISILCILGLSKFTR